MDGLLRIIAGLAILIAANPLPAQSLYKYRDENGNWIYTDRLPPAESKAEVRDLPTGVRPPSVTLETRVTDGALKIVARNEYHVHEEVVVALDELTNVTYPAADHVMRWILDPRSELELMSLDIVDAEQAPAAKVRYVTLHGDPRSAHAPDRPYRAPFAIAGDFPVTQAYPVAVTHGALDSRHAIDVAMPIGTDIHAARGGVVFEVASTNFRGGLDPERDAAAANLVRIMHDDGTHAVYAHLNWNSIRVRPGDRVERGQYIAESGNTGFSSGPHLHFAVLRNVGMRIESVPVSFAGPNARAIRPQSGNTLTAY